MSRENEILQVEHLTKAYEENVILKDVSFSVKEGEVVVIVGPSGCGKSTLLRCLNGLEQIQDGSVTFRGETVNGRVEGGTGEETRGRRGRRPSSAELSAIRQKVGMVFQSYELFPHKTILQNVMLAPLKVQKREKQEVREEALTLLNYQRTAAEAFRNITGIYQHLNVCLILRIDNQPVSFSAPEAVRLIRDRRQLLFFDDLSSLRIFEPSLVALREHAKPLRPGDAYYLRDNLTIRLKTPGPFGDRMNIQSLFTGGINDGKSNQNDARHHEN